MNNARFEQLKLEIIQLDVLLRALIKLEILNPDAIHHISDIMIVPYVAYYRETCSYMNILDDEIKRLKIEMKNIDDDEFYIFINRYPERYW